MSLARAERHALADTALVLGPQRLPVPGPGAGQRPRT